MVNKNTVLPFTLNIYQWIMHPNLFINIYKVFLLVVHLSFDSLVEKRNSLLYFNNTYFAVLR